MSLEGFFKRPASTPMSQGELPIGVNLVDFSQIVISTINATYTVNDEITEDLVRHCVINTLRSNVLKRKRTHPHVILCIDNGKGGYWRKKLRSYYKFKRAQGRDASGWDWEAIFAAMAKIREELVLNFPYPVLNIEGVEADDHIGVMTKYFAKRGVPVCITSSDGDFTQLQKFPKVKQWSPLQRKWVKPKHGTPNQDILFKCFKGDKKDGIAPMKAPSDHYTKTDGSRAPSMKAEELHMLMSCKESELPDVLTPDMLERYNENRELLDFEFIPEDIQDKIITQYKEYVPAPKKNIYPYFVKNRLVKLMNVVSDF